MIRLHNQNRTHTFIDVESGPFISLPKDETDKPPVNADINGLMTYGKTIQDGEPTPDNPADRVNIPPEFNLTVCGRNLFTTASFRQVLTTPYDTYTTIVDKNNFKTSKNLSGQHQTHGFVINVLPNTGYTVSFDLFYEKLVDVTTTIISLQMFLYDISNNVLINDWDYLNGAFIIKKLNKNESRQVFSFTTPGSCTKIAIVTNNLFSFDGENYHHLINVVYQNISVIRATEILQPYEPYIGSTYPYRLEDLDGNLHELCSLPDGTADTYNRETGELTKRTKSIVLDGSESGWGLYDTDTLDDYIRFYNDVVITDDEKKLGNENGLNGNALCSHFKNGRAWDTGTLDNLFSFSNIASWIWFKIAKSELTGYSVGLTDAQKVDLFKTWLGSNNVTVQYKLATPQTYAIKQYGKTYDGQVWDKNEKPKSIQYHTNIFTDVGAEMQCEVRKMGSKLKGTYYWITENGDRIVNENGDYIMLIY